MQADLPTGIVTTSKKARSSDIARATEIAAACGLTFVPRGQASTTPMIVVEKGAAKLRMGLGSVSSHPGMGMVRLRRLLRGDETDPLIELGGVRPGDHVLDATFGFGQDSLVLAHAVGESGRVVAFERSPLLAALAMAGMRYWSKPANEISSRIDLHCGSYRDFLESADSKSFDVVYFDPMFRHPKSAAPDFASLRQLADPSPMEREDLEQAMRVARRTVVVKDAWPGRELGRLGFEPLQSRRTADIVFGVLAVAES